MIIPLPDDAVVHRVGGADVAGLQLNDVDRSAVPPGLSVLAGGTPQQAANQMRTGMRTRKWLAISSVVGSATARDVRAAGFDVIENETNRFPNHARIIHPEGIAGFTDEATGRLAAVFRTTTGC